jgi:hypothetical protein
MPLITMAWIWGMKIGDMGLGLPFFVSAVSKFQLFHRDISDLKKLIACSGYISCHFTGTLEDQVIKFTIY